MVDNGAPASFCRLHMCSYLRVSLVILLGFLSKLVETDGLFLAPWDQMLGLFSLDGGLDVG